ncbi:hypothetical protein BC833DRAFT_595279 [Globomyces pollinis-pini]|nr:hypothetical protein BC833DRAFT_595279 [Globomyces pollinis-pini]
MNTITSVIDDIKEVYTENKSIFKDVISIGKQMESGKKPNAVKVTLIVAKTINKLSDFLPAPIGSFVGVASTLVINVAKDYIKEQDKQELLEKFRRIIEASTKECKRVKKNAQSTELKAAVEKLMKDLTSMTKKFDLAKQTGMFERLDAILFPKDLDKLLEEFERAMVNWKECISYEVLLETHEQVVDIHRISDSIQQGVKSLKKKLRIQEETELFDRIQDKLKSFSPYICHFQLKAAKQCFVENTLVKKTAEIQHWYNGKHKGYLLKSPESTGKTIFASKIGDMLENALVAYTLLDTNEHSKVNLYKPINIIAGFALQLSKNFDFAKALDNQPILSSNWNDDSNDSIVSIFQEMLVEPAIKSRTRVVLVLDSVDVLLRQSTSDMVKLLQCLSKLEGKYIKFILTASLTYDDSWFMGKKSILFPLHLEQDLLTTLKAKIEFSVFGYDEKVQAILVNKLMSKISEPLNTYQKVNRIASKFDRDLYSLFMENCMLTEENIIDRYIEDTINYSTTHPNDIKSHMLDPFWKFIFEFCQIHWQFRLSGAQYPTLIDLYESLQYEGFEMSLSELEYQLESKKVFFNIDSQSFSTTEQFMKMIQDESDVFDADWFHNSLMLWMTRGLKVFNLYLSKPIYRQNETELKKMPKLLKYYSRFWILSFQLSNIQFTTKIIKRARSFFNPTNAKEKPPSVLLWLELQFFLGFKVRRSDIVKIKLGLQFKQTKTLSLQEDFIALDTILNEVISIILQYGDLLKIDSSQIFKTVLLDLPKNSIISLNYLEKHLDPSYDLIYTDRNWWSREICRYETDTNSTFGIFVRKEQIGLGTEKGIEIYCLDNCTKPLIFIPLLGVQKFGALDMMDEMSASVSVNGIHQLCFIDYDMDTNNVSVIRVPHPGPVHLLIDDRVTSRNATIITTSDNRLYIWNGETKSTEFTHSLSFHCSITAVMMDDEACHVYIGLQDGTIMQWSKRFNQGHIICKESSPINHIIFGGNQQEIIYSCNNIISIFSLEEQTELHRISNNGVKILDMKVDPETRRLTTISVDLMVMVWCLETYSLKPQDMFKLNIPNPCQIFIEATDGYVVCSFSDTSLPLLCSLDPKLPCNETSTFRTTATTPHFKYDDSLLMCQSDDGRVICTIEKMFLHIYNERGQLKCISEQSLSNDTSIYMSSDGNYIMTFNSIDLHITLWNSSCKKLGLMNLTTTGNDIGGQITCGYINSDGSTIINGCSDGLVYIWNNKFELVKQLNLGKSIKAISINDNQSKLAVSIDLGKYQTEIQVLDLILNTNRNFFVKLDCNGLKFNEDSTKLLICSGMPNFRYLLYDFINDIEYGVTNDCFMSGQSIYRSSIALHEFSWYGIVDKPYCYFKNNLGLRCLIFSQVVSDRRLVRYYGKSLDLIHYRKLNYFIFVTHSRSSNITL